MSIDIQFLSFITMMIIGVYLGAMFDTNERLIGRFNGNTFLNFLFQFLFWLSQALIVFFCLVKINNGQVHLYFILMIIFGFWIYCSCCRTFYQSLLERLIMIVSQIIYIIKQMIYVMIVKPLIIFYQVVIAIVGFIILFGKKILILLIRPIVWVLRLICRLLPKNVKKYLVSMAGIYSKIENMINKQKR
ncbi:spore cortex biosynthesis protein YabQ [Amphibacillus cookii]|uniref:spore cortex biosynthesis protein YabQ n=1 Tax=Amphibacillus cookii TaxID=767787 RepID=UPI00195DDF94|nr:spore cortex biosynthesis protein YabQ [Amphibacillus cookii]MBM7543169.1 spore cortex biosynthesis protein YabQ [Amphibacillus cookii]